MKPQYALVAITAALLMAAATPAHATLLNFDFSFTGDSSNPGTVTGKIDGLTDNATSAASAVIIDTSTPTAPFSLPVNTIADVVDNSFTVKNGQITGLDYLSGIPGAPVLGEQYLSLNGMGGDQNFLLVTLTSSIFAIGNFDGFAGLTLTPLTTATPEPQTLILLTTALAGLLPLRSWANRRDRRSRQDQPEGA